MVAEQASAAPELIDNSDVVRIGAHLLKVAAYFDELVMLGTTTDEAIRQMRSNKAYGSEFVGALQHLQMEDSQSAIRWVAVAQLEPGMIIKEGTYSRTGLLLLNKGQEVTESAIARLKSFASLFGIIEPICVTVPPVVPRLTTGETSHELLMTSRASFQPRSPAWK
jgi:hypothetical protein